MKKLLFVLGVASTLMMTSCDKDQKALEDIAGSDWTLTSWTQDGEDFFKDFDSWSGSLSLTECTQDDGDCPGTLTVTAMSTDEMDVGSGNTETLTVDVEIIMTMKYNISEDGTQFNLTSETSSITSTSTFLGNTQSETQDDTCTAECGATGTINDDKTKISLTSDDGGIMILEKK